MKKEGKRWIAAFNDYEMNARGNQWHKYKWTILKHNQHWTKETKTIQKINLRYKQLCNVCFYTMFWN